MGTGGMFSPVASVRCGGVLSGGFDAGNVVSLMRIS